jgi:hypothetical protein
MNPTGLFRSCRLKWLFVRAVVTRDLPTMGLCTAGIGLSSIAGRSLLAIAVTLGVVLLARWTAARHARQTEAKHPDHRGRFCLAIRAGAWRAALRVASSQAPRDRRIRCVFRVWSLKRPDTNEIRNRS